MKKKNMGGMTEQAGMPQKMSAMGEMQSSMARANQGAPSFGSRRPATPASQSMPKPSMQPMKAAPAAAPIPTAMPTYKKGGVVCRGMGAAKRGGKFKG